MQPFYPEDGGSRLIRNIGKFLSDYVASNPEGIKLHILKYF
jgi:hypothetical protein